MVFSLSFPTTACHFDQFSNTAAQVQLRFYAGLNDFLAPALRQIEILYPLSRKASIKDVIESFGVPHTEVELILVNGVAVDFSHIVQDGERISVYPAFASLAVPASMRLRAELPAVPRFVVDVNLGRLTRYLRLLGFDCLYRNDHDDAVIAQIASTQQRVVLTRDRALLRRKAIVHGFYVRAVQPKLQVREVLQRFDLTGRIAPYSRCTRCNGSLRKTNKQSVDHRLEPLTRKYYHDFLICPDCGRVYWQGSHVARAEQLLDELTGCGELPDSSISSL